MTSASRFEREATLLASLNHPNIASIYGFEGSLQPERKANEVSPGARAGASEPQPEIAAGAGTKRCIHALVLELVEGPTLAERIERGPIAIEEVVSIARQIAEALEAGHEAGVIHRDLKPANIKLKDDGTVKVLDYGLAKAFEADASAATDDELSQSPTLTRQGTQIGVILGTAAYMSPEQAKGKRVDKRSDIWAFGSVLYEMLTGKKAFAGEDVSEVLAAVIRAEPDWSRLPAVPATLDRLLRRCLDKDVKRRLRDIGEARLALEGPSDLDLPHATPRHPAWLATALAATFLLGAVAMRWLTPTPDPNPTDVVRFDIPIAGSNGGHLPSVIAWTEDGRQLVFARNVGGVTQLFRRSMEEPTLVAIRGTEGGTDPFLSPDAQWVGFHAEGKMKKARLEGGPAATLCDWPRPMGASWGDNDAIVFASEGGLWEVAGAGGEPRSLLSVDAGSRILSWPEVLPGARAVLFTEQRGPDSRVKVLSFETGDERVLVEGAHPRFAAPAHMLFVREGSLWAVPFDTDTFDIAGDVAPVLEGIHNHAAQSGSQVAISRNGAVAYSSGIALESRMASLTFVDRSGRKTTLPHEPAEYMFPRMSPDGRRLAVTIGGGLFDIWILNLDRSMRRRLTFSDLNNRRPVWTPDGRRIAFTSLATGIGDLYWIPSDGSGEAEVLLQSPHRKLTQDFSPDGKALLYVLNVASDNRDIWSLTLGEEPTRFVATPFDERAPRYSPDGRWVAYVSNESGRDDVYVRPFPGPGGAVLVST